MIVLWFILACLFSGAFGAALMALLQVAKQTDIEDGVEPSLGQTDKIVYMTNAEKLSKKMTAEELYDYKHLCRYIPYEHCGKYRDCEQCKTDWLRMEAKK